MNTESIEEFRMNEGTLVPESALLLNGKKIDSSNPLLVYVVLSFDRENMGIFLTEEAAQALVSQVNVLADADGKKGKRMSIFPLPLHE